MPLSLRIPPETEKLLRKAAQKAGLTKTAFILDAIKEKMGLVKSREHMIRDLAGWMSPEESEELRKNMELFNQISDGDWT
ncbi:DUF1778 domain-containing protein [candidate division CSSED10-310 bacterium]|uniref:DUF1778 domain-containing protein n=1 Tax=candidate division CSSED10-310 bacterium TaxID=2855610 RepID=A0ABV6YXS3_UNCC1